MHGAGFKTAEIKDFPGVECVAGTDTETVSAPVQPEKPRKGRPKGADNKTSRAAKEAITAAAPHSFLIRVMEGRTFKRAAPDELKRSVAVRPTLEQSIEAGKILLRKLLPDLKDLTTENVNLNTNVSADKPLDPRSFANWLASKVREHGGAPEPAGKDPAGRHGGAGSAAPINGSPPTAANYFSPNPDSPLSPGRMTALPLPASENFSNQNPAGEPSYRDEPLELYAARKFQGRASIRV